MEEKFSTYYPIYLCKKCGQYLKGDPFRAKPILYNKRDSRLFKTFAASERPVSGIDFNNIYERLYHDHGNGFVGIADLVSFEKESNDDNNE